MKTAAAKELRHRTSSVLKSVMKGEEVVITMRGKSIAVLRPIEKPLREFSAVGFGMWKDRKDLKDATAWVSERRKERFQK